MATPVDQRELAAHLFLMAIDAYERCEPKSAEALIRRVNRCTDQAAALKNGNQQLQRTER
jgi:hypothetical protein